MAIFIPVSQTGDYHGSNGEMRVYDAFKKLPDDYIIFYSVKWGEEDENHNYRKGESDFLLFDPTRGFLAIEVKAGGIKRDNIDGAWYSISHDNVEHRLPKAPLQQAWDCVNKFRKVLDESPNDDINKYIVIPTVWFTDMKDTEIIGILPDEYQRANTFSNVDLDMVEAAVNRIFHRNKIQPFFDKAPRKLVEEVINLFSPAFRLVPSMSSEIKEKDWQFNQLTNEQAKVLDFASAQHVAGIRGVSGTGKTMIALECARRLPKDENVLFLCFNKLLLKYLERNFADSMPNVTFANLNLLYAKTGGSEEAPKDAITEFLMDDFNDHYQFDHIVIDEGQDFTAINLQILHEIVQATGGYFYVFYDDKQLVHQWTQETIDWLGGLGCTLTLSKNCRNTFEIARAAYSPVEISDVQLAMQINGDTPCLNNYSDTEQALKGIADTIRFYTEKGFKRDQITILTVSTLERSILANRDSIMGYRLTNDFDGDGILFTTARKFKGLESDVVIVIDVDNKVFKDYNAKCVFYVASSRAKHCVTYIATLSDGDMTKMLEDLDTEAGSKTPRRALSLALNIDIKDID